MAMDPAVVLALSKVVSEDAAKTARAKLKAGTIYSINGLVELKGTLKVGDDYEQTPTANLLTKSTFALLLHRMGFTREKAKEVLIDVFTQALNEKVKGGESLAKQYEEEIDKAMEDVKEITKALPKVPCKGRVTAKVLVTGDEVKVESKKADAA